MLIEKEFSLQACNTLGFDQHAEYFCQPESGDELSEALDFARRHALPVFMLGAGSNIVLSQDIPGLTINLATRHVSWRRETDTTTVNVDAGVNWHQLVLSTLERGLYGLENLSLIPGNSGAAPLQNIGAYGVELKDLLTRVDAVHIASGETKSFSNLECEFGYRDSIFKQEAAGQFAITGIELCLSNTRRVNTRYQALQDELESRQLDNPNAAEISAAVCHIRRTKLPDPSLIGNAGSFFKNPTVPMNTVISLQQNWPDLPWHAQADNRAKVPAGWLVEKTGWKGRRVGAVGVHDKQALVLVNHGGGTGSQLLALAAQIRADVLDKFGIALEQEPGTL